MFYPSKLLLSSLKIIHLLSGSKVNETNFKHEYFNRLFIETRTYTRQHQSRGGWHWAGAVMLVFLTPALNK